MWIAQGLGDQRDDLACDPGPRERVLQRLLDHIAHPAGGRGDEHAQGQRLDLVGRDFVPGQLVSHLRAVAVDQRDVPSLTRQVHDRRQARPRVAELIGDGGPLPRRGHGVTAERDDDGTGRSVHGGAT